MTALLTPSERSSVDDVPHHAIRFGREQMCARGVRGTAPGVLLCVLRSGTARVSPELARNRPSRPFRSPEKRADPRGWLVLSRGQASRASTVRNLHRRGGGKGGCGFVFLGPVSVGALHRKLSKKRSQKPEILKFPLLFDVPPSRERYSSSRSYLESGLRGRARGGNLYAVLCVRACVRTLPTYVISSPRASCIVRRATRL